MRITSTDLQAWALSVKERDGNACRSCGGTDSIHAHHIKPKSLYPDLIMDLENGVTLCPSCHAVEHSDDEKTRRLIVAPRAPRGAVGRITLVRDLKEGDRISKKKVRACVVCGDLFAGRADAIYCSGKCRTAAHRAAKNQRESRTPTLDADKPL